VSKELYLGLGFFSLLAFSTFVVYRFIQMDESEDAKLAGESNDE